MNKIIFLTYWIENIFLFFICVFHVDTFYIIFYWIYQNLYFTFLIIFVVNYSSLSKFMSLYKYIYFSCIKISNSHILFYFIYFFFFIFIHYSNEILRWGRELNCPNLFLAFSSWTKLIKTFKFKIDQIKLYFNF